MIYQASQSIKSLGGMSESFIFCFVESELFSCLWVQHPDLNVYDPECFVPYLVGLVKGTKLRNIRKKAEESDLLLHRLVCTRNISINETHGKGKQLISFNFRHHLFSWSFLNLHQEGTATIFKGAYSTVGAWHDCGLPGHITGAFRRHENRWPWPA